MKECHGNLSTRSKPVFNGLELDDNSKKSQHYSAKAKNDSLQYNTPYVQISQQKANSRYMQYGENFKRLPEINASYDFQVLTFSTCIKNNFRECKK